jgi:hypothetical protein
MNDVLGFAALIPGAGIAWSVGRIFVKDDWPSATVAGTLVVGASLSAVAWFAPLIAKPLILAWAAVGLIWLIRDARRGALDVRPNWILLASIAGCAAYFRSLDVHSYRFGGEDMLYWSYAVELLRADYVGNLRHPTYYPYPMSGNHLLPGAAAATLAWLIPNVGLGDIIEGKYIILVLGFASAIARLYAASRASPLLFLVALLAAATAFRSEIGLNTVMSNYLYATVLIMIAARLADAQASRSGVIDGSTLFLAIFLVIAKAPIFYVAAIFAAYLWWRHPSLRFAPPTLASGLLVVLVIPTWAAVPPPYQGEESQAFWVANPLNPRQILMIAEVVGWSAQDNFHAAAVALLGGTTKADRGSLESLVLAYLPAAAILPYVVLKYYGVTIVAFGALRQRRDRDNEVFRSVVVYVAVSILGWVLLRNGGSFRHQAHAYLVASILAFGATVIWACRSRAVLAASLAAAVALGWGRNVFDPVAESMDARQSDMTTAALLASAKGDSRDGFYLPSPDEDQTRRTYVASVRGERVSWERNQPLSTYALRPWVQCRAPTYRVDPTGYRRLESCDDFTAAKLE